MKQVEFALTPEVLSSLSWAFFSIIIGRSRKGRKGRNINKGDLSLSTKDFALSRLLTRSMFQAHRNLVSNPRVIGDVDWQDKVETFMQKTQTKVQQMQKSHARVEHQIANLSQQLMEFFKSTGKRPSQQEEGGH